jgi:hypothetical protein
MRFWKSRFECEKNYALYEPKILILWTILAVGASGILAQVVGQSNIERNQTAERNDAWRFVPQELPPKPSDPREKELLVMRGSDEGNPNLTPLDQPVSDKPILGPLNQLLPADPVGHGQSSGSRGYYGGIPFVGGEAIAIANFKSYQGYLTPSHRSIYTIVKLEIEQVLYAGEQVLNADQVIDLMMSGGTLRLSDGRVVTYGIWPENPRYCIQPGHRYLLLLGFDKESDTFHRDESIFWDITTGAAVPSPTARNIRVGQTALAGLPEQRFLELVRQAIDQHKK